MKHISFLLSIMLVLCILVGCGKEQNISNTSTVANEDMVDKDYLISISMDSDAFANNIAGESTKKTLQVYLPPSYYKTEKEYPVVYFLPGFGEETSGFLKRFQNDFDKAFKDGADEFIVVSITGSSKLGGNFYVNSPVTGNAEDFVIQEVIPYIDENYRTLEKCESRGISGFSMGGFGAYNLAFRHPDVFSTVITMSPGAIADGDIGIALESWKNDNSFLLAYARAFSPNIEDVDKQYGNIPKDSNESDIVVQEWINGFGNINQKLDEYMALEKPLKAIMIMYGTNDNYSWIPRGCDFMAKGMNERGITYTLNTYNDSHCIPYDAVKKYYIPFFSENLSYQ